MLVVEDEQDIAGLIKHALEREAAVEVEIAGSGDAALKAVTDDLPGGRHSVWGSPRRPAVESRPSGHVAR